MLVVRYQDPLRFQVICRFGGVYGRVETNLLKEQGRSDSEEQWLFTKRLQMVEIKAFK